MLLRDLDLANGLCNGTRMTYQSFRRNIIHVEVVMGEHVEKHWSSNGEHAEKQVFMPRIPLSWSNDEGYHKLKRK